MITVLWYLWLAFAIGFGVTFFFILVRVVLWLAIAGYRVVRWLVGKPNPPRVMSRLPPLSPFLLPKPKPKPKPKPDVVPPESTRLPSTEGALER